MGALAPDWLNRIYSTGHGRTLVIQQEGLAGVAPDGVRPLLANPPGDAPTSREQLKITAMAENRAGEGLAAVFGPPALEGLWEWGAGRRAERVMKGASLPVAALDVAPSGDALVALSSGAILLRSRGVWQLRTNPPFPLRAARRLRFRENGDLWVSSPAGLCLHKSSSGRWVKANLPGENLWSRVNEILETRRGETWLATSRGLLVRDRVGRYRAIRQAAGFEFVILTGLAEESVCWSR